MPPAKMNADKPILMSGPMIRAILDGRKTQTRRTIKPRGRCSLFDGSWTDDYVLDAGNAEWRARELRFAAGDRLWVREALTLWPGLAEYAADGCPVVPAGYGSREWIASYSRATVPSIHMPRWASRLTLDVTEVRVQRLQDISEEDAAAEGWSGDNGAPLRDAYPIGWFANLWNDINGADAWDSNPWVVVISFIPQRHNIDN